MKSDQAYVNGETAHDARYVTRIRGSEEEPDKCGAYPSRGPFSHVPYVRISAAPVGNLRR